MGPVNSFDDPDINAAITLMIMANSKKDDLNIDKKEVRRLSRKRTIAEVKTKTTKPNNDGKSNVVTKKPRKQKRKEIKLTSTPEMPMSMRERIAQMGGYEIALVIQKQLHDTDLNKNHGRLCLPMLKVVKFDFVTKEEEKLLSEYDGKKKKKGMNVMIVDPELRETVICLKKWKIGSGEPYCLMTHWNSFVEKNSLKSSDVVQLWSFRMDGADVATEIEKPHHLCFALTKPDISEFS